MAIRPLKVSETYGPFEEGSTLHKPSEIAAYLLLAYRDWAEDPEVAPPSDEIIRIYKEVVAEASDTDDDGDIEVEVFERFADPSEAKKEAKPEGNVISVNAAVWRQSYAMDLGHKLPTDFRVHAKDATDASRKVKKTAVWFLDDVMVMLGADWNDDTKRSHKWEGFNTLDLLDTIPVPGSSKGTNDPAEVEGSNRILYDLYTSGEGNNKERSSFGRDMLLVIPEYSSLADRLDTARQEAKDKKTGHKLAEKKAAEDEARELTRWLGDGITIAKCLKRIVQSFPNTEYEIQREDDGTPAPVKYPILIWQRGGLKDAKAYTVGQLRSLLRKDSEGLDGFDRALAKGGPTAKAIKEYGLPKKAGTPTTGIQVKNPEQALDYIFALGNYLESRGDLAIGLYLDLKKAKSEDQKTRAESGIYAIGLLLSRLVPTFNNENGPARFQALLKETEPKKEEAA